MSNSFYWDGTSGAASYGDRYAVMPEKPVIQGLEFDTVTYDESESVYTKVLAEAQTDLSAEERTAILGFIKNAVVTLPYKDRYVRTTAQDLTPEEKSVACGNIGTLPMMGDVPPIPEHLQVQACANIGARRVHAQGGDETSGYWIQYEDGEMEVVINKIYENVKFGKKGVLYQYGSKQELWPVYFKDTPKFATVTIKGDVYDAFSSIIGYNQYSIAFYALCVFERTFDVLPCSIYAKGRWK